MRFNKLAFTLAEVLITLAVVGIVAAITIPVLINNYQKRVTVTKLKQAYAILTNTVKLAEIENGGPLITLTPKAKKELLNENVFVNLYFAPYLTGITKQRYNKAIRNMADNSDVHLSGRDILCMQNGICFQSYGNGGYDEETDYGWINYLYIYVDINGVTEPNRAGKDVFYFAVHFNNSGTVIDGKTYGVSISSTIEELYNGKADTSAGGCNRTSSAWSNGAACTEIIMRNNWEIPKEYTW